MVLATRGFDVAGHLVQVGADRIEPVVPGEPVVAGKGFEHGEPGFRPVDHRDRDGPVQRDHRVRRDPLEQFVEHQDLAPVRVVGARRFAVHGHDRGL